MALFVTVPISTEVIESNADCALSGAYENGVLVITIDTRGQNVHQRLGLGTKTRLHWGAEHWFEVQELSGLTWPIRYRVITRDGYYLQKSQRVHFTTSARGLDAHRGVSEVVMRAATLLVVIAGVGYRRTGLAVAPAFPYRDLEIGPASLGRRDRLPVALSSGDDPSSRSGPADHRGPFR